MNIYGLAGEVGKRGPHCFGLEFLSSEKSSTSELGPGRVEVVQ
jgi:hypothetical protein